MARVAGVTWDDLGLGRRELGTGARVGALSGGCAVMAVGAAAATPATRTFFAGAGAAAAGRGHSAAERHVAAEVARITFASVPPEEFTYRSALLGLRLGIGSRAGAVAWSSLLFGVSHISPTVSAMSQGPLRHRLAHHPLRQAAFVAGNVTVTSVAGALFAWLRLRSGSVLAPLLAHAALNNSAMLAARAVLSLGCG